MVLRRSFTLFKISAAAALCALLLLCSEESREGAAQGLQNCLCVLVPSLFPFMAVTQLAAESGLCQKAGSLLRRPARRLFGLSGALAPVLLLSLVGGYPVGASGIAALYRQGVVSKEEARRAALFAVCAGPGFAVSFIGETLFGNAATGFILFAAQAISVLLSGMLIRVVFKSAPPNATQQATPAMPFAQAVVAAVNGAAKGMLSVCAFVVLFSALTGVLARFVTNAALFDMLSVLLEVCGAVTRLSKSQPVWVTAFAMGFGGVCVHCQIFGVLGEINVNKLLFFLFRIIQGVFTALLTQLGLRLFPQTETVFSTAQTGTPALMGGSVASGAVLLAVSVCFLISVRQILKNTV